MDKSHAVLDRLFETLANRRQRYVLYYLDEAGSSAVTLDRLADKLCRWEREWLDRTEQARAKHQENIRIDLHHVHLPQMADNGVIDYDARSGTVRSRMSDSVLASVEQESNEWPRLADLFTDVEVQS